MMVNSTVTTMEEIEPYQTDFNDLMLAKPKTYKNGIRAYKNSKVNYAAHNEVLVCMWIVSYCITWRKIKMNGCYSLILLVVIEFLMLKNSI